MSWTRIGACVSAAAAALSITLACAVPWLLLTDPVTVAGALEQGRVTPIARELATVVADALRTLATYL